MVFVSNERAISAPGSLNVVLVINEYIFPGTSELSLKFGVDYTFSILLTNAIVPAVEPGVTPESDVIVEGFVNIFVVDPNS